MINFTNEEIKNKSSEWSLNEDVKLLNKLKSLNELLSLKSKEIIDNVDKTDNKISSESILIKNLVNDFCLVGHKQFTENRVEEENENKLYNKDQSKDIGNDSLILKSIDQDTLIHEQMKTALDNSLNFIREKLKEIDHNQIDNLNTGMQLVEELIKKNKYHQKKLPPTINSKEFMNEIFNLVKESSNNLSKSNKINNLETKSIASNTETSSIISDSENISTNDKIMEINENKFIEHLNTTSRLQPNQQQLFASSSNDLLNEKEIKITNNLQNSNEKQNSPTKSNLLLDQSQRIFEKKDKIENINSLRNELDAIFGKVDKVENSSKNKIFDEVDSDDDLFTTVQSSKEKQNQKLATKDLFKSNDKLNSSSNESLNKLKKDNKIIDKTSSNLFSSNIKSNDTNKKLINKLFDSDSDDDDDELFSSKLPTNLIKDKSEATKSNIDEINKISNKSVNKSISNLFDSSDDKIDEIQIDKTISKPTNKIINKSIDEKKTVTNEIISKSSDNKIVNKKEVITPSKEITKPNKEIITISTPTNKPDKVEIKSEKMPNKKDLFKNQLEDLFNKKRDPNRGFLKISKTEDDINDDNNSTDDKYNDNLENKTTNEINTPNKSPLFSPLNKQRKEFDLFSSKPSSDPFLSEDLNSIKTSTLDNNLVKSRVKFQRNRKRPTKVNQTVNEIKNEENIDKIESKSDIINSTKQKSIATKIIKEDKDILDDKELIKEVPKELIKETIKTEQIKKDQTSKSINNELIKSKILFTDSDEDHKKISISKQEPIKNISTSKDVSTSKSNKKDEPFKNKEILLSDSEKSDDDFFSKKTDDKKSTDKQMLKESLDKKFKELFDDSDDDELFLSSSKKKSTIVKEDKLKEEHTKTVQTNLKDTNKKLSNLFDSDSDDDDELFKK